MASGGARPGAGRKKGQVSKATARRKEIADQAIESGLTPLEFMLQAMRDESHEFGVRLDAAKSAAPYVHPRLSAVAHEGSDGGPLQVIVQRFSDGK